MADFLLASTPARSHMAPMLTIAADLVRRGHQIRMIAGARFEQQVRASGATYVPLPPECDFDDSDLDKALPGRVGRRGLDRLRFDIDHLFLDALVPQSRALEEQIEHQWPDAILVDIGYTGVLPMLQTPARRRPPVVTAGLVPFQFASQDTAPFGTGLPPSATPLGRLRNRVLNAVLRQSFAGNQRHANDLLRGLGAEELSGFFLDALVLGDVFLQFCTPSFEYPRSDLPAHVRFVGPIQPDAVATAGGPVGASAAHSDPESQGPVDDGRRRPLVLVTQGTVDNLDLGLLLAPALQGLADLDVDVLTTTGGRPLSEIPVALPRNARAVEFVPFAQVLPEVDVLITNGGYGGVNHALSYGIPLVVAGRTEDKPEVAARVAWTGCGIDLKTDHPTPAAVGAAVRRVLDHERYRINARRIADDIARTSALDSVADALLGASVRTDRAGRSAAAPRRSGA